MINNPEKFIRRKIKDFVAESSANKLFHLDGQEIFAEPLVGYADGKDSLFKEYKKIIGQFHLTPAEILFNNEQNEGDSQLSVISWVLPIAEETKKSNQKETKVPSNRWAHTRNCGENFNIELRKYLVKLLTEEGYKAVAPYISEQFHWVNNSPVGLASTWSERHALYAAGLGTFGLCDGLITEKGKAMRCGSVVTDLKLKASKRDFSFHYDHCLFLTDGKCGQCIKRCPAGAITSKGHDKDKCLQYQKDNIDPSAYGVKVAGCGLCQTDVPCESRIPD